MSVFSVCCRQEIESKIEEHEAWQKIVLMNTEADKPMSPIDKAHIAAFVALVVLVGILSIMGTWL